MSTPLPPRVLRARMQLMLSHPYLASALARLPVVNAAGLGWCETMATDGYYIYVNPAFCEGLSEEEVMGVFAHELLHCALGHIDRRAGRERLLWNVAIDHATNLLLRQFGFRLPAGGLWDGNFAGLTAEEIYAELIRQGWRVERVCGFDLHLEPGDVEGLSQRERDYPSTDERRRLRGAVLRELTNELRRLHGRVPAGLEREAGLAARPQVSWRNSLARFVSGLRRSDYRLYPFNKKHLWRGIYLPSLGVPGPDRIVLAIDTSGSVSAEELGQFLAELDRLRALTDCRLTLLQCDAAVQRADEVGGREATVLPGWTGPGRYRLAGGGGTDFRPVFDWIAARASRENGPPDALIYCTDGFGSFPPRALAYPVVWVLTAQGERKEKFPFGMVIRLEKE
ncbi:MAG: VWA-like domain-containing protein [Gemmataceae bacterium]|nr:VWA-like domain-containing protein [Gemmataceae bacterium]